MRSKVKFLNNVLCLKFHVLSEFQFFLFIVLAIESRPSAPTFAFKLFCQQRVYGFGSLCIGRGSLEQVFGSSCYFNARSMSQVSVTGIVKVCEWLRC